MKTTKRRVVAFAALLPTLTLLALGGCSQKDKAAGPKDAPAAAEKEEGRRQEGDRP